MRFRAPAYGIPTSIRNDVMFEVLFLFCSQLRKISFPNPKRSQSFQIAFLACLVNTRRKVPIEEDEEEAHWHHQAISSILFYHHVLPMLMLQEAQL